MVLCKRNETSPGMISEKLTPHYYRHCLRHHYISISQDPCSCLQPANPLSSCHLLYSLSLFKSSSSIHVTVGCELSWPGVCLQRLQSVTMGQGRAALHSIQKQRWGVSQGVNEGWSGVGGVVSRWEKGKTGSAQRWRAVHGAGVILCQPPLRWKLVLAPISHSGLALEITNWD